MLPKIGVNGPCEERFCQEKYNIYLTNSRQSVVFWTFLKLRGYRLSWQAAKIFKIENRKIYYYYYYYYY
jgi:hypothetical protein